MDLDQAALFWQVVDIIAGKVDNSTISIQLGIDFYKFKSVFILPLLEGQIMVFFEFVVYLFISDAWD